MIVDTRRGIRSERVNGGSQSAVIPLNLDVVLNGDRDSEESRKLLDTTVALQLLVALLRKLQGVVVHELHDVVQVDPDIQGALGVVVKKLHTGEFGVLEEQSLNVSDLQRLYQVSLYLLGELEVS